MDWTLPVAVAAVLAIVVAAIGALVRLVVGPLTGEFRLAAGLAIGLVLLFLLGAAAAGARGTADRWLANGGYW